MKSSSQKIKVKRENNLLEIFLFLTSKGSQDPREPVLVKFVFHEKVVFYPIFSRKLYRAGCNFT